MIVKSEVEMDNSFVLQTLPPITTDSSVVYPDSPTMYQEYPEPIPLAYLESSPQNYTFSFPEQYSPDNTPPLTPNEFYFPPDCTKGEDLCGMVNRCNSAQVCVSFAIVETFRKRCSLKFANIRFPIPCPHLGDLFLMNWIYNWDRRRLLPGVSFGVWGLFIRRFTLGQGPRP